MVGRRSAVAPVMVVLFASLLLVGCGRGGSSSEPTSVAVGAAAGTIFEDQFDGTTLGSPWVALDRPGDASNQELQCYRPANVAVTGGNLVTTAEVDDSCPGHRYTSAMVQWRQFAFTYGTLEFRARMAGGTGTWPAVWMLGSNCQQSNITTPDNVGSCHWPEPGSDEIDVTEVFGGSKTTVNQGLISTAGGGDCRPEVSDVSANWHTYQLVWAPGSLIWKIDGTTTCTVTSGVPSTPMFVMVNTAVGGSGGGTVDDSTLPQQTLIDYLRVTSGSSTPSPPATPAAWYHALTPARIIDSRTGPTNIGPYTTPWGPGDAEVRAVQIGGRAGVPPDAAAVVLNVTAVNPSAGSFLQLWPADSARPVLGSNLNFEAGKIVANAVTVGLGDGGAVRVFNAVGHVDVIMDVAGYYESGTGGGGFTSLDPARILDSRAGATNIGPYSTPWGPGPAATRDVQVAGRAGVPADAEAVVLNVTAVEATASSFLQMWPSGSSQPTFGSSVNFTAGSIVANQVTARVGALGAIRILNAVGAVDVVIDVSGYYVPDVGEAFHPIVPGRVLDSRAGSTNVGPYSTPWSAGVAGIRDVQVASLLGLPSDADSAVLNVTAVRPTAGSFLQVWPTGSSQPSFGSNLNFPAGRTVANAVTARLGGGNVRVFNAAGSVDVIVDVAGYFG